MVKKIFKEIFSIEVIKRLTLPQLVITFASTILVWLMVLPIKDFFDLKIKWVIKDIAAIAKVNPLSGFLSNMGMIVWAATVAICLFSAFVLYRQATKRAFWFMTCSGILSGILLMDDLFMLHDSILPTYLHLSEYYIFALYVILLMGLVFFFWEEILQTNFYALALVVVLFGVSNGLDILTAEGVICIGEWEVFYEEGLKWIGIGWWLSYFFQTCGMYIKKQFIASPNQDQVA